MSLLREGGRPLLSRLAEPERGFLGSLPACRWPHPRRHHSCTVFTSNPHQPLGVSGHSESEPESTGGHREPQAGGGARTGLEPWPRRHNTEWEHEPRLFLSRNYLHPLPLPPSLGMESLQWKHFRDLVGAQAPSDLPAPSTQVGLLSFGEGHFPTPRTERKAWLLPAEARVL